MTANPAIERMIVNGHPGPSYSGASETSATTDWRMATGYTEAGYQVDRMTLNGVIAKTAVMFVGVLAGAAVSWLFPVLMYVGMIVGLVLGLVCAFRQSTSPALIMGYAVFEGMFLGGISATFEAMFPGIILQAVTATFIVFIVMLALYRNGKFRLSTRGKKILVGAMLGYLGVALINFVLVMTGVAGGMGMYDLTWNGIPLGIIISLAAVTLGAISLAMDFEGIEVGIKRGFPTEMEWSAAFGLMVSLVWLYVELLRLIGQLRR